MTGFGRAQGTSQGHELVVEINTVNRKNLDLQISLPRVWAEGEIVVSGWLKNELSRGAVYFTLKSAEASNEGLRLPGEKELRHLVAAWQDRAERVGITFQPDANWLLRIAEIWSETEGLPLWPEVAAEVELIVLEAIKALIKSREQEGAFLAADLRERIGRLQEWQEAISQASRETVPHYREMLLQRLQKLSLTWDPGDDRVVREVAVFADRCDISEETIRLRGHLELLDSYFDSSIPIGRKADFLLQEINRELNTIGSKANHLGIAHLIVEAKNECERIREQIQNIE